MSYGLVDDLVSESRRANRWRRVALFEFGLLLGHLIARFL